jgi:hypothetical protein
MATKSIIVPSLIDRAKKAHNCQANSRHRIRQGEVRLKVKNNRSWDHYCSACATIILSRDLEKLQNLQTLKPLED